jgi:hypothetical protein
MSAARTGVSCAVVLAAISFYGGFGGVAQAAVPGLSDAIGSSPPAPVQAATGPVVQTVQQTVAPVQHAATVPVVQTAQQTGAPVQQAVTAPVVQTVQQTVGPVQQATTAPSLAAPVAAVATMADHLTATVNQTAAAAVPLIGSTASNAGSAVQTVLNVAGAATGSTAGLLTDTTAGGALMAATTVGSVVNAAPTTVQPAFGSVTGSVRPGVASQGISAPAAPAGSTVEPPSTIFSSGSIDPPSVPTRQGPALLRDRAAGQPALAGWVATTTPAPNLSAGKTSRGSPTPIPHLPRLPIPGFISATASGGGAGGGLLAFAILLSILLLVTPKVGRRLRPALALGLSPADLAARERPG